jgi:hypothetical protein
MALFIVPLCGERHPDSSAAPERSRPEASIHPFIRWNWSAIRLKLRLRAMERDAGATEAEAISAGCIAVEDLQWHGTLHTIVVVIGSLEKIVIADVHDIEVIADKANSVGAGDERMAADFKRDLGEEIALVFFLDGGGVAGSVNEHGQHVVAIGELDASGIAELGVGGFARVENRIGQEFGGFGSVEDGAGRLRRCGEGQRDEGGD